MRICEDQAKVKAERVDAWGMVSGECTGNIYILFESSVDMQLINKLHSRS